MVQSIKALLTNIKRKLDESDEELLNEAIPEIRERFNSTAKEIIVPLNLILK